ncbi:MAG TPA: hypothetical protein VHM28_05695, partial [Anaerolineales bacterium]|nr:hypothetical protein [Anaerolineales bacterium]
MKNKLPIFVLASILAGAIAGFVGYAIGQYFYMLFVFPFVLLIGGVLLFIPILKFFKALNPIFNALCGLLMGLMIFTSFHYTEYSIFRSRLTARLEASQSINEGEASKSVDAFLKEKTGLSGFLGFMKYQ